MLNISNPQEAPVDEKYRSSKTSSNFSVLFVGWSRIDKNS